MEKTMTALDLMILLQQAHSTKDLSQIPVMFIEDFVATQAQKQHIQFINVNHNSSPIEFITQCDTAFVIGSIPEVD